MLLLLADRMIDVRFGSSLSRSSSQLKGTLSSI